jgi:NADPH:quinone reductase-like Zn-dependent oxidoreductase
MHNRRRQGHSPTHMCAVQITRFGGPEVLDIVDVREPTPGPRQQLYDVSTAGLNFADTHHRHRPEQRVV